MADIRDKVVTVGSLEAVNNHVANTYMTQSNPTGSGTLSFNGSSTFIGNVTSSSLTLGKAVLNYDTTEGALKISFLA